MARQLPEVIEDVGRCKQVVDVLERERVLAVDCEGVSLGVDGPLTLVQVGNYSGEVYLFDILRNKDLLSRGRLGTLLESPNIIKVRTLLAFFSQNLISNINIHFTDYLWSTSFVFKWGDLFIKCQSFNKLDTGGPMFTSDIPVLMCK